MWQAEPVQAWVVAMVVVLAVALALTIYGALHDRTLNRRRAEEMLGPPQRAIPHLPEDARSPAYVTEAQARRRPTARGAVPFDELGERPADVEVGVGYASEDFVTDEGRHEVVLDDPLVLVCADDVDTVRELLPALEIALRSGRPLVVVAPVFGSEVLGTLEVNAIQGKVPGVAVVADEPNRTTIAASTGAVPVDRTDRRSGWLDPAALGRLARWTSTRTRSRLVLPTAVGADG